MRFVRAVVVLFVIGPVLVGSIQGSTVTLPDWCYYPQGTDCSWYRSCLAERHPSQQQPGSYAIDIGDHICNSFSMYKKDFSETGQKWINYTRACLQKALVPIIEGKDEMDGDAIKIFAYRTHLPCYIHSWEGIPTFCDLPISDWFRIVWTTRSCFYSDTLESTRHGLLVISECIAIKMRDLFHSL